jgi:tripartite ATP-independent transporter DctM subunit
MTTVLFGVFIAALLIGVPVTFALAIGSMAAIAFAGLPLLAAPQRIIPALSDNFSLLAIPLFILAGNIIGRGGLGHRIVALANVLVGRSRGGLSSTNIVASMLFGGVSGSATADTSAIGTILVPAMVRQGYDKAYAAAVTVASSPLGTIIPPSIIIIVYCWVTENSIAGMFAAGYLPGIFIGLVLIGMGWVICIRRGYPVAESTSWSEKFWIFLDALPGLSTVIIIIGGIVGGVFTATEAGAVAAVWGLLVSRYYYRELAWSDLPAILVDTAKLTGIVTLIIGYASVFAWLIAFDRLPYTIAQALADIGPSNFVFLALYLVLLVFLGTFLAPTEGLIIVVPILYPVALTLGIDPFHFGMVSITGLALGHITPPVGLCLFVGSAITGLPVGRIVQAILPFYVACIFAVLMIALVPQMSTWLPHLLGYR